MRRWLLNLAALAALICALVIPASAESAASRVEILATVNADGSASVTVTALLRLEEAYEQLYFPLPAGAENVDLANGPAMVRRNPEAAYVDISRFTRGYVGDATIAIDYRLPNVITVQTRDENDSPLEQVRLILGLSLLNGFQFPVEQLGFTITMPPGEGVINPGFVSTYRQGSIESDLTWTVRGSQIIGSSTNVMNDREEVTLVMDVDRKMFSGVDVNIREGNPELIPMAVFAVAALVYWLLFLRTAPLFAPVNPNPPAGVTAGELGGRITSTGTDLTGMIFSWAQLGYVVIHLDGNGRVMLHKRMDMGNERGAFENKVFRLLFGQRRVVDATGSGYARLCKHLTGVQPSRRGMYKTTTGNVTLFRGIACVSQGFCGICVAMNMNDNAVLQVILAFILAIAGVVSAWFIQEAAFRTFLRGKLPVLISLGCIALWILLGLLCGQVWIPLGCSVAELLLGYFAAYGGRYSEMGRYEAKQALGLRRYLKHLPRGQVDRLLSMDPEFFFRMAPYALSFGVLRPFANQFGRRSLDQCPYLISPVHGKRTAGEWASLMEEAANRMDARSRQLRLQALTTLPGAAASRR